MIKYKNDSESSSGFIFERKKDEVLLSEFFNLDIDELEQIIEMLQSLKKEPDDDFSLQKIYTLISSSRSLGKIYIEYIGAGHKEDPIGLEYEIEDIIEFLKNLRELV